MIGHLRGTLTEKKPPFLIIDVQGVGYELQASMTTIYALPAIDSNVFIYTHMVVREDAQLLYAFATQRERLVFRELIKITGVGPKLALTILSGMDVMSLMQCIAERDSSRLVKLPGVGKKIAERLIIEMKADSFSDIILSNTNNAVENSAQQDAVSALIALGYKAQDAHVTMRKVLAKDANKDLDSEALIKLALQSSTK